jgi:hypothetical protein
MEASCNSRREAALGALAVLLDEVLYAIADLLSPTDIGRFFPCHESPRPHPLRLSPNSGRRTSQLFAPRVSSSKSCATPTHFHLGGYGSSLMRTR